MSAPASLDVAWASPLPATEVNFSRGALWTWLIFSVVVGVGTSTILETDATGGAVENTLGGATIAVCAFIAALIVTLLPEMLIGLPLTIFSARLLRQVPSIWPHLVAQFVAGAVTAIATCALALTAFEDRWSERNFSLFGGYFVGLTVCAGLCSAAGWALALREHRRRLRATATAIANVPELESP